jgi:predicted enzyme related to lactoylglutathione lyase
MAQNIKLIVYPAKDIDGAKALFSKLLDTEPYADTPYYVGYRIGELEIGLDPSGEAVVAYTDVADIKESLQALQDTGAVIQQDVKDVGNGLLIAQVKDANGNVVGLRQGK